MSLLECMEFVRDLSRDINVTDGLYVPFNTGGYLPLLRSRARNRLSRTPGIVQRILLVCRCGLKRDQMTLDRKIGMEGVAEETGIAPAKI